MTDHPPHPPTSWGRFGDDPANRRHGDGDGLRALPPDPRTPRGDRGFAGWLTATPDGSPTAVGRAPVADPLADPVHGNSSTGGWPLPPARIGVPGGALPDFCPRCDNALNLGRECPPECDHDCHRRPAALPAPAVPYGSAFPAAGPDDPKARPVETVTQLADALGYPVRSFGYELVQLIHVADQQQRQRLALAYPMEVYIYQFWRQSGDGRHGATVTLGEVLEFIGHAAVHYSGEAVRIARDRGDGNLSAS